MKPICNENGKPIRCNGCGVMFSRLQVLINGYGYQCGRCAAYDDIMAAAVAASGRSWVCYDGPARREFEIED